MLARARVSEDGNWLGGGHRDVRVSIGCDLICRTVGQGVPGPRGRAVLEVLRTRSPNTDIDRVDTKGGIDILEIRCRGL